MITDSRVEIDAPASLVWEVFSAVERWPDWTASVTRLTGLDAPELAVGRRFEIVQPRLPKLVWSVTELEPGTAWTWEQRSPGGRTVARHEVTALGPHRTLVHQQLEQAGPLGGLVGRLTRKMTVRYLELEAQGLKARSEERSRLDAPAS